MRARSTIVAELRYRRACRRRRARAAVLVLGFVLTMLLAGDARGHVLHRVTTAHTLEDRERLIAANARHSQGAVRWLEQRRVAGRAAAALRWHRSALGWQRRELREVRAELERRRTAIPSTWARLADCETGGDRTGRPPWRAVWDYNGSSGFDGGLQFAPSTWRSAAMLHDPTGRLLARYPFAYLAPARVQVDVAATWLAATSWKQWPSCSLSTGLR